MHAETSWRWLNAPLLPLGVLLLAVLLFLGRLDAPLLEPQEARYAEIPRQMLAEQSWLVPVLHGEVYLDKPPLFYWCVLAGYRLLGVADWVARLVPGLTGVGVVLLVAWWGRLVNGARLGLLAALVLCLCPRFLYQQRQLTMDCLLCLWTTLALASAYRATRGPTLHLGWWAVASLACGLGLLTKGPVVFALVVPVVFALAWLEPGSARVGLWSWTWFGLLAVLVAVPWFVAVSLYEPDFPSYFFWRHHVERFAAPFDHAKPVWYYLPGLMLGLMPWALLLPALVTQLRMPRPGLRFALISAVWPIVFFSLSGCKRPLYLLPALPPLALVFALLLQGLPARTWKLSGTILATGLLAVLGGVTAAALTRMLTPLPALLLFGAGLALCVPAWYLRRQWGATFAILSVAFVGAVLVLLPAYTDAFGLGAPAGLGAPETILCFPQRFDSATFHFPESDTRVFGFDELAELQTAARVRPGALLLVRSGRPLESLLRAWPEDLPLERCRPRGLVIVLRVAGFRSANRERELPASPG